MLLQPSQDTPEATGRERHKRTLPRSFGGRVACPTLISGFQNVRQYVSVVSGHPVCGSC